MLGADRVVEGFLRIGYCVICILLVCVIGEVEFEDLTWM